MNLKVHAIPLKLSMAYLIESEAGLVLVDAGLRGEEKRILAKIKILGRVDLKLIYITHAHLDHYGCAAAMRRITGAPIAIHCQDAEAMAQGETRLGTARNFGRVIQALLPLANPLLRPEPVRADIMLEDGQVLTEPGLPATVLFTPGHTMGSTCLLFENRFAFAGDLVTNSGQPRRQRFFAEDWSLLPGSLARLQEQNPETTYSGHGMEPIRGQQLQMLCGPLKVT
ncbi:MAG TPA: MBL fold metallo-hydrolase [Patescibacteria group bacterium]|nr:MBL fold metallo-hydrolase [Patescibacteria group bacterium]